MMSIAGRVIPNFLKIRREEDCLIVNNSNLDIFFLNKSAAILFVILIEERDINRALNSYKALFKGLINEDIIVRDFDKTVKYFIDRKLFLCK